MAKDDNTDPKPENDDLQAGDEVRCVTNPGVTGVVRNTIDSPEGQMVLLHGHTKYKERSFFTRISTEARQ